ncbi:MAG: hypothetical protein K6U74_18780 [Firmicutes bacterium]|nr:hypothetical protein [Bacillota bacterium]
MSLSSALYRLERGDLLGAAKAVGQVCEARSSKGLCRATCQRCRLEAARQALLSGRVASKGRGYRSL